MNQFHFEIFKFLTYKDAFTLREISNETRSECENFAWNDWETHIKDLEQWATYFPNSIALKYRPAHYAHETWDLSRTSINISHMNLKSLSLPATLQTTAFPHFLWPLKNLEQLEITLHKHILKNIPILHKLVYLKCGSGSSVDDNDFEDYKDTFPTVLTLDVVALIATITKVPPFQNLQTLIVSTHNKVQNNRNITVLKSTS